MSSLTAVSMLLYRFRGLNCRSVELMQVKFLFLSIITTMQLVAFVQTLVNYNEHVRLT